MNAVTLWWLEICVWNLKLYDAVGAHTSKYFLFKYLYQEHMFGENINNVHKSTDTLLAASKKFGLEGSCEKPNVCMYMSH